MGFRITYAMAGLLAASMACSTAIAQEQSTNRVAAKTDWSIFVEDNPK
jgi:hypothetical protein